ncbi:hypothetical protein G6F24_016189 [Rhizopus arrhizus]|nr:hypothetical protein G6F24_016189 [Rhizopus arrhizus]
MPVGGKVAVARHQQGRVRGPVRAGRLRVARGQRHHQAAQGQRPGVLRGRHDAGVGAGAGRGPRRTARGVPDAVDLAAGLP